MKFFTSIVSLAFMASSSSSSNVLAFAPHTSIITNHAPRSVSTSTSTSTLNMVADDAKVILVTGSSRGLGKSIALDLGKHGQKLVINYVSDGSKEAAEATCKEIKELGGDAVAIQADSTYCILLLCFIYFIYLF